MCQICDVERGDAESLMFEEVEVKVGSRLLDTHLLSIDIVRDDDGNYGLASSYFMTNDDCTAIIRMPIQFCPFCGKELQHEPPKQYPWNQEKRG